MTDPPSWAALVRAPNPGPMTLEGTNTWVLRAPGAIGCAVVDPGPLDDGHLAAVAAHAPVHLILLTHRHPDHAEGAHAFQALTGAPMAAADAAYVVEAERLTDGVELEVGGLLIRVLATPGHTSDSVSFVVEPAAGNDDRHDDDGPAVLTGDTVLGRGTTVVAHPDGVLADYLHSLARLRDLRAMRVLPGHGAVREDISALAAAYLRHREERLEQVRAALAGGAREAAAVVRVVYADVDPAVWPAAELSVRAQLAHLDSPDGPGGGPAGTSRDT